MGYPNVIQSRAKDKRRQDLYDFNRELSALVTALRAERLTSISITTHRDRVSVELNRRFLRYVNGG